MPNGEDLVLEESSRQKLDGIVQKMSKNGESDDDIQFVVNDFKNKYGVKKKESSEKSEPSTSDSKTPSPLLEKSGEKADRQQTTAGNIIPSFNPNDKGLSPSEKQLLKDRDLALKRRDEEIESRNADKFVQENTGLKARTGSLQKDANGEIAKSNANTIPSLREKNLLPSSKYVDFGTPSAPKKGSYDEFDLKNEEEKQKKLERADIALEEGQKDAELAKLSIADKAKSYANSFLQGGFGGLASTVNLAGTVYTKTKEAITGKKDWGSRADDEIARRTLNNFQQEYIPEANALKGSLGSQVARGFGQMGAMAAAATVTGGSAIIPSVSAFAETYDSESQEALKNGASESTANKVALGNAFASMGLEAIPVLRMLNRANKTTGGATFKQIALELGKKGVKGGLEEGGTEMAQQGTSNLIAQKTYDKKRELGSGIVDAGGVGGIIGLTSTIALSALGVSLKNAKTPKEKAEIESQIAELEGLKNEAIIKEQKQIDSKKAEILASLEPDGNGGVIMTPEAKAELDKLENARVQVQEPTKQSATITEGAKPSAFTTKQQEPDGKPASTEANKGATVESAIIEIGGETFEGKNHAEAILKAQQAGKDISQVDRQGEGMFKLSDGTVISREQAKETFGADKAEMLITQDDNANKANDDYEKVKTEFKREDIANKIASNDTGGIANTPIEDVPLLVEERTNPKEDVLTIAPIQENITLTVPQPTIAGAQEQEGATGVQAVSENVQEAGTTDAEGVSVGQENTDTQDTLDNAEYQLGVGGDVQKTLDDAEYQPRSDRNVILRLPIDKILGIQEFGENIARGQNGVDSRINRIKEFLKGKPKKLEASLLNINKDNTLGIDGRHRLEAAKEMGATHAMFEIKKSDEQALRDLINEQKEREQNKITNEPTKEQDLQASVLDQSGTEDSETKKGAEQVEKNDKQKESKFNKRQRLGIPVNEVLQQLADKIKLMYDVKTNKDLLAEANNRIEKDIDDAYEFATQEDPRASELTGMFATAGRLIPILENAIKNAESADAKAFWTEKLDVLRKAVRKQATTGGQAIQALVTVGNIMPMRDSVELIAIAQREAFIKKGTKDGKFEESVKNGVKEDAEKVVDNIINNDSKVKELEAKIIELEAKIAAGKKTKRKEAVKKAIDKLDSLINNNLAFSDATGMVAIAKQGLIVARESIKAGDKVVDAIEKAVRYVNAKIDNKKWDEKAFRDAIGNSLSDVREDLDALYDEKKSLQESKKKLKDSIRAGLQSGDFSDLESHLTEKGMSEEDVDTYVSNLKEKHEKAVIYAVSKRIDKNLGLTVKRPVEKSLAYIEANSEPLTADEIEARLKNEIDKVSAKVEKLVAKRIEKNTATDEELAEKKKLAELKRLESQKSHEKADKLAMDIFKNEPLTEEEINARLSKKKKELDDKIESERAKRIKKNLETTKEKQLRTERENLERDIKGKTTSQIAKKIANSEPLTPDEVEALFKKKNNLEDITPEQSNKLKELYDEVERVSGDVDLHKEALDKLRHEAQKLVPKTGWSSFMNAYDSIWHYPSILSGHMTQIANYADALMQSFTPDMISKTGRESFKDQFKGLKSAVNKAKIGLREGFLSEGLLNNGQPDKLNLSRKTAEDFAKEGNKIAKVTKWVGRVMSLPNTFGEAIKFNALSNIIQRDLTAQGLKGRELKDRKNELLFGTVAKMPEYEAMAVEMVYGKEQRDSNDVLKEAKVKRTISNLILEDMQKQMTTIEGQNAIETAERIKDIATYQNDATGLISILPRLVGSLENNKTFGEAIKFVNKKALRIDFLNTVANIANSKLNYLPPYGYLRANNISTSRIVKWAWPEWEGMLSHPDFKDPKNFEEKRRILQKANIGTMIVVGASAMAISGAIKDEDDDENKHRFITGDLTPSDIMDMASKHVHKKEAYESVPPNSIKLPVFGWTNYMLTPFAGALAMVGNLSDRMYANKHKELTKESIMADVMWAEARALKSIILDGTPLGSTIESNKPSKMTTTDNALQQVAVWGMTKTADIVGSSIPNLVKSIGKQIDPTLYTPKDLPTIIVKQMGLLNWYSAMGGELKTGYAVDILGNKTGTKSGDRYFNLLLEDHPEDKKIYDLLLASYKEPMNYPALLSSNMAIRVELMSKEEHDKKLGIIKAKFEKGALSQVQMQNQLDALEKASKKDDDIGNYPLLYSQALEFSGSEFKKMLKENYDDISNTKNSNEKQNKINTLLSVAKDLAKAKYGAPPKRVKNKL